MVEQPCLAPIFSKNCVRMRYLRPPALQTQRCHCLTWRHICCSYMVAETLIWGQCHHHILQVFWGPHPQPRILSKHILSENRMNSPMPCAKLSARMYANACGDDWRHCQAIVTLLLWKEKARPLSAYSAGSIGANSPGEKDHILHIALSHTKHHAFGPVQKWPKSRASTRCAYPCSIRSNDDPPQPWAQNLASFCVCKLQICSRTRPPKMQRPMPTHPLS